MGPNESEWSKDDSVLWHKTVQFFKWFYRQWCRVEIILWRIWGVLKFLWLHVVMRHPHAPVVVFRPEFDVSTIPPEHFFRMNAMYEEMKRVVGQALAYRAEAVQIDLDGNELGLQYFVDGVGRDADFKVDMNRATGGEMIDIFRMLAGLSGHDQTPRQHGNFGVTYQQKHDFDCQLLLEWKPSGDRELVLWFSRPGDLPLEVRERVPLKLVQRIGMRPEQIDELLRENVTPEGGIRPGLVLVSAPPQHGFSTTFNSLIKLLASKSANRPVALERRDEAEEQNWRMNREIDPAYPGQVREVGREDAVYIQRYDKRVGEKPVRWLMDVLREKLVQVVCVRRLEDDDEMAAVLCNQKEHGRLSIAGLEAKDVIDALMTGRELMGTLEDKYFRALSVVLNQRLVRKLCDHCKIQYPASPQLMAELDLSPSQVAHFWRPGRPMPLPDEEEDLDRACPQCGGSGYDGRTAVIEMLVVDEAIREAVRMLSRMHLPDRFSPLRQPKSRMDHGDRPLMPKQFKKELKKIAKRAGHLSLAEQGIYAAAAGITSIDELRRVKVLKDPRDPDGDDD